MEFKMIPSLELRGRPLIVVIEGEWRTVEILAAQSAVDPFFVAQRR
jgi:hypothetical protein